MSKDKDEKKKKKINTLKKKGVNTGAAVFGMGLGFVLGPRVMVPSAVGVFVSKKDWQESIATGSLLGSLAAGTHRPTDTGDKMADYKEDAKARGKNLVRGLARGLWVDTIAEEQFDKLDASLGSITNGTTTVANQNEIDLEAAEEFIRQLELVENDQQSVGKIETYLPTREATKQNMSGFSAYRNISSMAA